ncbi:MAG: hypothetical protein U0871_14020 [Gemmataceae bacterium]
MSRRGRLALLAAAVGPAVGCWQTARPHAAPTPPSPALTAAARQVTPPDVAAVPDKLTPVTPPAATDPYLQLAADQCRELACTHAATARAILAAADGDDPDRWCDWGHKAEVAQVRRTAAGHLAAEARNRTAGAALELYYKLLEVELLTDLLVTTAAEVDDLVRTGETLQGRGFQESPEFFTLRRQQVETRAEAARLRQGGRRLNAELKALIGTGGEPASLLPTDHIRVPSDSFDVEKAVQLGLASRPDLRLLRDLDAGLNARTVDAVRQAVIGLVPALKAVTTAARVLAPGLLPHLAEPKVESTHRMLRELLAERTAEAEKDIRTAADEWASQQELVGVARRRQAVEAARVHELAARRKSGAAVEAEYRRAKLDALKADAEVIREAVKWKLADVKVRQAMGILCGDGTADSCRVR